MANLTILDIAKYNGNEVSDIVDENLVAFPEIEVGAARTITGTSIKQLVRTTNPSIGFRNVNEGVATTKAVHELRETSLHLVDCSAETDAQADQVSDQSIEEILAEEMSAKVRAGMIAMSSQFYYSTGGFAGVTSSAASPTKGFVGLGDIYDSTNMEVSAAGSSGTYSSVWAVRFGGLGGVQWAVGNDGMFNVGATTEERLTDGSSNPYDGLRKAMTFWIGLKADNPRNSICRLKLVDTVATLTDAMLAQMIEKFPVGFPPTHFFMTRRSARQLKTSRTATTQTGNPAAWPTQTGVQGLSQENIPIYVTNSISEAETS